jgi:hypothetical protein
MMTASAEALSEAMTLLVNRFRNSSRTVEVSQIVSGDRPSERQPFQSGLKSSHGTMWPWVTSTAVLNEVVKVQ